MVAFCLEKKEGWNYY